ncbi:MAG: DUF4377 domain-containing protein [Rikenellaceae bacterium]|nr:DUF4377 domain-containing protein [Rikenellaceae bacterium]
MKHLLALLFFPLLLTACNKDRPEQVTVTLASRLWTDPDQTAENRYRYYVKWGSAMEWTVGMADGTIAGFEYEEGYEWLLKLDMWPVDDVPGDGISAEYKLKKILSKDKKESEGLPIN